MVDLPAKIELLPDIYDKTDGINKSNIRKIFEVMADVFQEIEDTHQQMLDLEDIFDASGKVLDDIGADYRLPRFGKSDDDYRALILAKQYARISGNGIDKVLNFFAFFVNPVPPGGIKIIEFDDPVLTENLVLLPLYADFKMVRGFSVEVGAISEDLRKLLQNALMSLKGAAIYAGINLKEYIDSIDLSLSKTNDAGLGGFSGEFTHVAAGRNCIMATRGTGFNSIVRSLDNGLTWSVVTVPGLTNTDKVWFFGNRFFVLSRSGAAAWTDNLGATWVSATVPIDSDGSVAYWSIAVNGWHIVLSGGKCRSFAVSHDKGKTWEKWYAPYTVSIGPVVLGNCGIGACVYDPKAKKFYVKAIGASGITLNTPFPLESSDNGKTWIAYGGVSNPQTNGSKTAFPTNGTLVNRRGETRYSNGYIYSFGAGGDTAYEAPFPPANATALTVDLSGTPVPPNPIEGISSISSGDGYFIVTLEADDYIYITRDNGATWFQIAFPYDAQIKYGVYQNGYACFSETNKLSRIALMALPPLT